MAMFCWPLTPASANTSILLTLAFSPALLPPQVRNGGCSLPPPSLLGGSWALASAVPTGWERSFSSTHSPVVLSSRPELCSSSRRVSRAFRGLLPTSLSSPQLSHAARSFLFLWLLLLAVTSSISPACSSRLAGQHWQERKSGKLFVSHARIWPRLCLMTQVVFSS